MASKRLRFDLHLQIFLLLQLTLLVHTSTNTAEVPTTTTTTPTTTTTTPTTTTPATTTVASVGSECQMNSGPCFGLNNSLCEGGKCKCQSDFYPDSSNKTCLKKHQYGETCDTGTGESQCTSNFTCDSGQCLCPVNTFYSKNICNNVGKELNVKDINPVIQETSLNLTWQQSFIDGFNNSFEYIVVVNEDDNLVVNANITATITNLTQGTKYVIRVDTSLLRNPCCNKTARERNNGSEITVWTIPAQPGELLMNEFLGPDVNLTFNQSAGYRDNYTVTITETDTSKNTTDSTPVNYIIFLALTNGSYYDVNIVAKSGNQQSVSRQGRFRVKPSRAGMVNRLNVTSAAQVTSEAQVTWSKPDKPNGNINGYTLKSFNVANNTCVFGLVILCQNCSNSTVNESNIAECSDKNSSTESGLNNDTLLLNYTIINLKPAVSYIIYVTAFNEVGKGFPTNHSFNSQEAAAPNLKNLSATAVNISRLNVNWIPGDKTGDTTYNITWCEQESLTSENYSPCNSTLVEGYDTRNYVIENLISYWNYNISVFASTKIGRSPQPLIEICQTNESAPGKVENFSLLPSNETARNVNLTFNCPAEKKRGGQILLFYYNSTVLNNSDPGVLLPNGNISVIDCSQKFSKTVNVTAENTYFINVFAATSRYMGETDTANITVEAQVPKLQKPILSMTEATENTLTVNVSDSLFDKSEGSITFAGLIVCSRIPDDSCHVGSNQTLFKDLPTWKNFMDKGYIGKYRPTPDDWNDKHFKSSKRRKRSFRFRRDLSKSDTIKYVIGNETCDSSSNGRCNGPLEKSLSLKIIAFACTKAGCAESPIFQAATLPGSETNVGAIVGGVIGGLAILAIAAVIIFFVIRRYPRHNTSHSGMNHKLSLRPTRRPIKLRDFSEHLKLLHNDSNLRFQEEFESIQDNSPRDVPKEEAMKDENKIKNRYVNILPYDHTRVKLSADDDNVTNDFINANYIPGYTSPREYIATQGPMTGTVDDFWRMIWEQKSGIIVMLSDLTEKGRPKVDLYWPTEVNLPMQYGDVVVEMTANSTLNKYTIRNFKIFVENQEERKVTQFFIPGWEDYGANLTPDDILDFINIVRKEARSTNGPVTVHCSAGVGRTGTFIALDFLSQFVSSHDLESEVDIYNLVLNMRHHRPLMVQSEKQYIFIHDTLNIIIDKKIQSMKIDDKDLYQNLLQENIYANQAFVPEENLYENQEHFTKPTTVL